MAKLWVDDLREAPAGYYWSKSVNQTIRLIEELERKCESIELIDLDHDAGDYFCDGGDFIKVLDWMEATGRSYPIRIHTQNPVGRMNMELAVYANDWELKG